MEQILLFGIIILILVITVIFFAIRITRSKNVMDAPENKQQMLLLGQQIKDKNDIILQKSNEYKMLQDKYSEDIKQLNKRIGELEQKELELNEKDSKIVELEKLLNEYNKTIATQKSQIDIQSDYWDIKNSRNEVQKENLELRLKLQNSETNYTNLEKQYNSFKKDFEENQNKFKIEIENITDKILKEKSKEFSDVSRNNIDIILKPFKQQIESFQKEIKENTIAQTKNETTFKNHIESMVKETHKISQEADSLVNALKGNRHNKNIGNWGENTLETILSYSGLHKGIHYETQESFNVVTEDGITKKQIPDFIIYIPTDNGKNQECMVIDSKISIKAYLDYCNADTKEGRNVALSSHIDSIRQHIKSLSPKNYERLPKVKNIDYVMMFIPIEPAYILAMDNAPNLWKEAYDKRILLMSPTNIIASLRLISLLWNINDRSVNSEKIAELGKSLYDKLVTFVENFEKVGKSLDVAKKSWITAKTNLINDRQGIIKKAESFKALGITPKKEFPEFEEDVLDIEEDLD